MDRTKKHIAVVAGGDSTEYEISVQSGQVVAQNLDPERYETYMILLRGSDWTHTRDGHEYRINKADFSLEREGEHIRFDAVFIAIHGTPGENGKLQAYFDLLGMRYSTCGQLQAALTFNKVYTNAVLQQFGLKCARSRHIFRGTPYDRASILKELGLPVFVKPSEAGSSFGISRVSEAAEFDAAVEKALEESDLVLVEAFLDGTEVTCGIHNFDGNPIPLPLTEIVPKTEYFDYEAKYLGASDEITPARISAELTTQVQAITVQVFRLLQLEGIARVDYMLCDEEPYIIEVNTVPGLSDASLIPQQARAAGYTLPEFFGAWVEWMLQKPHQH